MKYPEIDETPLLTGSRVRCTMTKHHFEWSSGDGASGECPEGQKCTCGMFEHRQLSKPDLFAPYCKLFDVVDAGGERTTFKI